MDCPNCGSHLYERSPTGWSCVACKYREALDPTEHIHPRPPRSSHGDVYGQAWSRRRKSWASQPIKAQRGSIEQYLKLRKRSKMKGMLYLVEHEFAGEDVLNRHYYLSMHYLDLGMLDEAQQHAEKCREYLAKAKDPVMIQALLERVEKARSI